MFEKLVGLVPHSLQSSTVINTVNCTYCMKHLWCVCDVSKDDESITVSVALQSFSMSPRYSSCAPLVDHVTICIPSDAAGIGRSGPSGRDPPALHHGGRRRQSARDLRARPAAAAARRHVRHAVRRLPETRPRPRPRPRHRGGPGQTGAGADPAVRSGDAAQTAGAVHVR